MTPPLIALTPTSISCKANDSSSTQPPPHLLPKLDRRNVVLLGLGGSLYGAGTASALGPILPPDLSKCSTPDALPDGVVMECLLPFSPASVDFRPRAPCRLYVRPMVHEAGPTYVAKYEKALALMKALPDSDPSFKQQSDLHCAYCNGAYDQVGSLDSATTPIFD